MLFRLNDELEYFEDKKDIDDFLTETYGYDFQQFVYNTYKEHLIELIENKIDQGFVEEFAFESDLDEYKMWGNGIALPCAEFVFESIVKQTRY